MTAFAPGQRVRIALDLYRAWYTVHAPYALWLLATDEAVVVRTSPLSNRVHVSAGCTGAWVPACFLTPIAEKEMER